MFHLLTGLVPADSGTATFRGAAITGLLPHRIVARGVGRSFQIISIFQALTVFENVRIAAQARHRCRFAMFADAGSFADLNAETMRLLAAVGLADKALAVASNLSHGDQRLLEIAVALATRPDLLLLDEPLAGLAAHDRVRVADLIRTLRQSVTIVLIDHDIDQVLALSDRITPLHQGRVIAEGGPAEIQQNAEVQTAYLGHLAIASGPVAGPARAAGEPLLRVAGPRFYDPRVIQRILTRFTSASPCQGRVLGPARVAGRRAQDSSVRGAANATVASFPALAQLVHRVIDGGAMPDCLVRCALSRAGLWASAEAIGVASRRAAVSSASWARPTTSAGRSRS